MTIEKQCNAACARVAEFINRSAAQHVRAMRREWEWENTAMQHDWWREYVRITPLEDLLKL